MRSPLAVPALLVLCGLSAVPPGQAATSVVRVPLAIRAGESCWYDARGARLLTEMPAAGVDGSIAIEAEAPTRHFCRPDVRHPGAALPRDDACSGGGYLDAATYARYEFQAPRTGDYWLWCRVASPKGRSRFRDEVNGTIHYFFEEENEQPQPWHWVMRRKVRLREGANRLVVTEYSYQFPKIDKFILAPSEDWQPQGPGPEVAPVPVAEGWVATSAVTVPGLKRLVRLEGLPPQATRAEYSVDEGQTWTDLPLDADAAEADLALTETDRGAAGLTFRITLGRQDATTSPRPLALVAEVDTDQFIELSDGQTRLVFDGETAGLFLVENLATGEVVSCPGSARPVVSVDLKAAGQAEWTRIGPETVTKVAAKPGRSAGSWEQAPGEPQTASTRPSSVEVDADRLTTAFNFSVEGLGRAEVTYAVQPGEDGSWNWSVTARSAEGPADVVAVTFPIIEHVRLGPSGLNDRQFRMQSFGHQVIQPGKGPLRDAAYCGQVVMPWTEVYDDTSGLYLGAHDPAATNVLFGSQSGGLNAEHFTMWTRKLDDIRPGEGRTWHYVVAAHPGQWHWGADRYREWFYETHGRAQCPDWMKRCEGWLNLQCENYGRSFRFSQLPDWLTRARALDLDWVQVWGQFAYDGGPCCHDFPALSPLYGGLEGWKQAVAEIRRRGGRVGGYFVYDRLDILPLFTDYFLGHFRKSEYPPDTPWVTPDYALKLRLVEDPAGALPPWPPTDEQLAPYRDKIAEHQEQYAEGERARMVQWWARTYVNDAEWWEYLRYWIVEQYLREYGCNTCYIDVLGCGTTRESYDPRRGHNGDGGYGAGKYHIAKTVVEGARSVDPEFGPAMEGMADLPGLYCASMCSGVYRGARNVMRYTFPERIFIHGTTNPGSGGSSLDRYAETFREAMRYDIVGRPTSVGVYLLNLQRGFAPWIYESKFMDTVGLEVSDPRVQCRWLLRESEGAPAALVTVVNREYLSDVTATFDGSALGGVRAGFYVGLSGAAGALELEPADDRVRFPVPREMAAHVYLVGEETGREPVWPVAHLKRDDPSSLDVTVLNLTDQSQSGRCSVEMLGFTEPYEDQVEQATAQLPLAQAERPYSVEPHKAAVVSLPVESLRRLYSSVRVRVGVTSTTGEAVAREFLILPLAPDGSFEFTGDGTDRVVDGERSLELPASLEGYQHRLVDLWVLPGRRYRASVQAMRTGFQARVHSTAFMLKGHDSEQPLLRKNMDRERPNEWQTLSYEFETPPDLTRAAVYLYNVGSPDTAWFDDLFVEDLGPSS